MPDSIRPKSSAPQFGKAEYAEKPDSGTCAICKQLLGGIYYRVQGRAACEPCAMKVRAQIPLDNHANFTRALLLGMGGAILGFVAYSAFTIATNIEIGFVSLAVGWLVGKAMQIGSQGAGGRRYQITAVILTYAAVSLAAIPVALWGHVKDVHAIVMSLPTLALLGLASPLLELQSPVNGALGLFILFVGMRFAWRLTAGLPEGIVAGPFEDKTARSPLTHSAPSPPPLG